MPNVMIFGFGDRAANIRTQINLVMSSTDYSEETVTTISHDSTIASCVVGAGKAMPYLVVRDTKLWRARLIAKVLNKDMDVDVEIEKLEGFLPRSKPRTARDFVRAGHR